MKIYLVEEIVSMLDLNTEEAKRIVINAVSDWGLQKSENFVELLVNGELEKASKRATKAELNEIIEFIQYYKGDEQEEATEERTVFFSAQEAYNHEQAKQRKANDNEVKRLKVEIQEGMKAHNEEVVRFDQLVYEPVSYEDGDNYVPTEVSQAIAENAYQGFKQLLTDWVLDNSAKIAHYSGCALLYPDSVKRVVQIVGGKYGVGEFTLSQLAELKLKAENDLNRLAGSTKADFYDWKAEGLN